MNRLYQKNYHFNKLFAPDLGLYSAESDNLESISKLRELLYNNIYQEKIFGSNFKPDDMFYKEYKPKDEALHNKFIWYNSKRSVQILMFDDDTPTVGSKNILEYCKYLDDLKIPFTFLIETDRGYQFGLILDKPCWTRSRMIPKLEALKNKITLKIDGDLVASNRKHGVWRNPLVHKHIFREENASFSLDRLFLELGIGETDKKACVPSIGHIKKSNDKLKISPTSKVQNILNQGYKKGNRHNFISAIAYKILFEDRSKSQHLLNEVLQINNSQDFPISDAQVKKRVASVLIVEGSMYNIKRKRERGKYSDYLFENSIHTEKNRFKFGGLLTTFKKRYLAHEELIQNKLDLFNQGITNPTIKQISKISKFKKSRLYELETQINKNIHSAMALLAWVVSLGRKEMLEQGGKINLDFLKAQFKRDLESLWVGYYMRKIEFLCIFEFEKQNLHKNFK